MPAMDAHYAQVAVQTRPPNRDLRHVVPNGETFASKGYGVHKEAARMPVERERMPDSLVIQVPCRDCHAKAGERCTSIAKNSPGGSLAGFHASRTSEATFKHKRK